MAGMTVLRPLRGLSTFGSKTSYDLSWITGGDHIIRNVFGNDAAGADDAVGAYGYAAQQRCVGADGGAFFY